MAQQAFVIIVYAQKDDVHLAGIMTHTLFTKTCPNRDEKDLSI